ncbi:MAG TPA: IucA/IucC family C-terminal-domain containing protein [Actinomycetota bacterium]|nr:IucA/IucC family C-terminal-domain containing protein [Actinomycetota bacterium]
MNDWEGALSRQLDDLGRWLQGRFVPKPDASDEVVPAERYLDEDYLRNAIGRAGTLHSSDEGPETDPRVAVSRFTRQYSSSLSIIALVSLAQGVGLDVSPGRCRMIVRSNVPFLMTFDGCDVSPLRCAERPTSWPVEGPTVETLAELREYVWRSLYAEHLAPLFERALDITNVSPLLMWTNAAEWVGMISDAADEYMSPTAAAPFVEDRLALLGAPQVPGLDGENPIGDRLTWEPFDAPDFPNGVQVREMCCITYMLPDRRGRLCQNCGFLSVEERVALIRERHGVALGGPSGPAEQAAIRRGLEKLGTAEESAAP